MALNNIKLLALLVAATFAQQAYSDEAAEAVKSITNQSDMLIESVKPTAVRSKRVSLEDRFSSGDWRARGEVTLWYDNQDVLIQAEVANNPVDQSTIAQAFEQGCSGNDLY